MTPDPTATTSRRVETKAADGSMRLGELRAFIHELDIAGGIKSLRATAVRSGDSEVPT